MRGQKRMRTQRFGDCVNLELWFCRRRRKIWEERYVILDILNLR